MSVRGNFRILILYDVADVFDLDKLQQAIGPAGRKVKPSFSRRTPEYIRLEESPIVEAAEDVALPSGERLVCTIKYYSYAVVAVRLTVPFACEWDALLPQAARWIDTTEIEPLTRAIVARRLQQLAPGPIRPAEKWLEEDYLVVEIQEITEGGTSRPTAAEVVAAHGEQIVRLIRGETHALSKRAVDEALENRLSYYDCDLVAINATGALVYDAPEDAAAAVNLLSTPRCSCWNFATTIIC